MVGSTSTIAKITESDRVARFYAIYLNSLAGVAEHYGARLLKNAGDALILYFPKTIDSANTQSFVEVLHCCFAMKSARGHINSLMEVHGLPQISYRISAEFGPVEVTKSKTSVNEDMFGHTINLCSKMNSMAPINGIIVGSDLYQIFRSHQLDKRFVFKEAGDFSIGMKSAYPLYSVSAAHQSTETFQVGFEETGDKLIDLDSIVDDAVQCEAAISIDPISANFNRSVIQHSTPTSGNAGLTEFSPRYTPPFSHNSNTKKRILLIDDDLDVLEVYRRILTKAGYDVEFFSDPREALNAFAFKCGSARRQGNIVHLPAHYDLVITDIRMPGINGLELYRIFKLLDSRTKILIVTALDILDELHSMIPEIESQQVIRKPIDQSTFLSKIKTTLER